MHHFKYLNGDGTVDHDKFRDCRRCRLHLLPRGHRLISELGKPPCLCPCHIPGNPTRHVGRFTTRHDEPPVDHIPNRSTVKSWTMTGPDDANTSR